MVGVADGQMYWGRQQSSVSTSTPCRPAVWRPGPTPAYLSSPSR
jgi:hypothetical protein